MKSSKKTINEAKAMTNEEGMQAEDEEI